MTHAERHSGNGLAERRILVVMLVIVAACMTRLTGLAWRPLHHDEGVNYWFAQQIIDTGRYAYDPANYHGPTFFFALAGSFLVFGVSEFSLRLPAAVAGIALVLTPLMFLRRQASWALSAALLLLLSPSVAYFSRYAIHESLLAGLSLTAVLLLSVILDQQAARYLPFLAAVLALLLATKETAVIVVAALGVIGLAHRRRLAAALRQSGGRAMALVAVAVFVGVYAMFFTSFFTHPRGLVDSLLAFSPWISRGFQGGGHTKPWPYYLGLIARFEFPLLLFATIGIRFAWRTVLGRGIALWTLTSLVAYSWLDYKTPWLIVNLTVPLALLAAVGYQGLADRPVKRLLLGAGAVFLLVMAVQFNVRQPWQNGNPYAYEHTDADALRLVAAVNAARQPRAKVWVLSPEYWPLPFYLRRHDVGYPGAVEADQFADFAAYDFVMLPDRSLRAWQPPPGFGVRRFRLRSGVALLLVSPQP